MLGCGFVSTAASRHLWAGSDASFWPTANGKRHPVQMGRAEVEAFLTELTTRGQASAGTQNQALTALLFLYREVCALSCPGWRNCGAPSGRGPFRWCSRPRRSRAPCRSCWVTTAWQPRRSTRMCSGAGLRRCAARWMGWASAVDDVAARKSQPAVAVAVRSWG